MSLNCHKICLTLNPIGTVIDSSHCPFHSPRIGKLSTSRNYGTIQHFVTCLYSLDSIGRSYTSLGKCGNKIIHPCQNFIISYLYQPALIRYRFCREHIHLNGKFIGLLIWLR